MKKVLIIGAGISGLYIANLINSNPNFDFKIIEKRKFLDLSEGYGIQLSVNSIKLLNKIGFKSISASEINYPSKVNFFQAKDLLKVCEIDLVRFNHEQNRYSTLKRSTLLDFLFNNLPREKIKFNSSIKSYDQINNKVYLDDNSDEIFDFMMITDGVFSNSKSIVNNQTIKPKYNNCIALRAKIFGYEDRNISIFMGPNFHYVIYPVNQNNEYNFIAIIKRKSDEIDNNDLKKFQTEEFLNSSLNVIKKNSSYKLDNLEAIKAFPVFVSQRLSKIDYRNVFLSGDALFAFPPSFAQGASQSIETANDIFEDLISGNTSLYKDRIKKISSINLKSKINHFAFQLSNPFNTFIRNLILKNLSKNEKFLENYLGKIYRN